MKYLGSATLETERLILKAQSMEEQYYLWKVLMIPEVNKYFLAVPQKFREKITNWDIQKKYYEEDMKHANDKDVFKWSVFLKDTGECIGRLSCQERSTEDKEINDPSIRGVGWLIDPKHQGNGYATEAARAMIDYMFTECDIKEIITGAAISNEASWRIMERLGFEKLNYTRMVEYTFVDEPVEDYEYVLTKEKYLEFNSSQKVKRNR